jgi:hypothetical protein
VARGRFSVATSLAIYYKFQKNIKYPLWQGVARRCFIFHIFYYITEMYYIY